MSVRAEGPRRRDTHTWRAGRERGATGVTEARRGLRGRRSAFLRGPRGGKHLAALRVAPP